MFSLDLLPVFALLGDIKMKSTQSTFQVNINVVTSLTTWTLISISLWCISEQKTTLKQMLRCAFIPKLEVTSVEIFLTEWGHGLRIEGEIVKSSEADS